MRKIRISLLFSSLLAVYSCSETGAGPSDFDLLCEGFTKLKAESNYNDMNTHDRANALESILVEVLEPDRDAYIAWTAIRNADPVERYHLYQEAARSTGHSGWECEAMRESAHEVGSSFEP